jgi:hypothetical protein
MGGRALGLSVEEGDMLIVWKLDRLARSLRDLTIIEDLQIRFLAQVSHPGTVPNFLMARITELPIRPLIKREQLRVPAT